MIELIYNKAFAANFLGDDYIVGDIHGNYYELITCLNDVKFNFHTDRLFALGDLIDRGKDSKRCINLLAEPWFYSVIGNHEYQAIKKYHKPPLKYQYQVNNDEIFLISSQMPLTITLTCKKFKVGLVHAKSPTQWPTEYCALPDKNTVLEMLWDRGELNENKENLMKINGVDVTVMGHNSVAYPVYKQQRIWIDTYAKAGIFTLINVNDLVSSLRDKNEKVLRS